MRRYTTILAYLKAVHADACRRRDHEYAGKLASLKHTFVNVGYELHFKGLADATPKPE